MEKASTRLDEFMQELTRLKKEGNPEKVDAYITEFLKAMEIERNQCSICGAGSGWFDPALMITALNESATYYREAGVYDKAVLLYERMMLEIKWTGRDESPDGVSARINLAAAQTEKGEREAAAENLNEAWKILEKCTDTDQQVILALVQNLASIYAMQAALAFQQKKYAEAADGFAGAADVLKQYTGESREYMICKENEKKARAQITA